MSKDRMREAAARQVEEVAHEIPEDRKTGSIFSVKKANRTRRVVVRLDPDEYRRLDRYCQDKHLAVSSAVRSILMEAIRKA